MFPNSYGARSPSVCKRLASECARPLPGFAESALDETFVIPDPVVAGPDGLSLVPYSGPDLTTEVNGISWRATSPWAATSPASTGSGTMPSR